MDLNTLVEKTPLLITGLWASAAAYCAFISPKGRQRLDERNKLIVWADEFREVLIPMTVLSALSSASGFYSYYVTKNLWYAYGATTMAIVFPYTYLFLMPLFNNLLKADKDNSPQGTSGIIQQWVNAHKGRLLLGIIAGVFFFFAEASPKFVKLSVHKI